MKNGGIISSAGKLGRDPLARREWRVVPHVLPISTIEVGAPMTFIVSIKSGDLSIHSDFRLDLT